MLIDYPIRSKRGNISNVSRRWRNLSKICENNSHVRSNQSIDDDCLTCAFTLLHFDWKFRYIHMDSTVAACNSVWHEYHLEVVYFAVHPTQYLRHVCNDRGVDFIVFHRILLIHLWHLRSFSFAHEINSKRCRRESNCKEFHTIG